jgi:hypothetical protein
MSREKMFDGESGTPFILKCPTRYQHFPDRRMSSLVLTTAWKRTRKPHRSHQLNDRTVES